MAETLINEPNALSKIVVEIAQQLGEGNVYIGAGYNNVLPAVVRGVKLIYVGEFSPYLPDSDYEQTDKFIKECDRINLKRIWEDPVLCAFPVIAAQVRKFLKETHVIAPLTWGPFTLAGQIIGVENFVRKMVKDPAAAKAVIELAINAVWEYYRPFVEGGLVDIIYLPEPTASGDMISPRMLEKFAVPAMDKCLELYHKQGIPTLVHICGNLSKEHLRLLNEMVNMDVLSVDSKVSMALARSVLTRKCIMGNVDVLRLERSDVNEVVDILKQLMSIMEGHERFVVAPSCDLPPNTPFANVKAMFEFVRNYRLNN
nr:uroporphyrinogen decarboxylase family protein [Desulfofundulus thermobenzoicus]